jgi:hypothetical protein
MVVRHRATKKDGFNALCFFLSPILYYAIDKEFMLLSSETQTAGGPFYGSASSRKVKSCDSKAQIGHVGEVVGKRVSGAEHSA